ncbi:MAG: hypothetical protein AMJ53_14920 [Gammaproteobacteria bacterium SG8_11]|nr:MAG: hypothetical protein AMJ53_14920 [Gammaproteobacteria bacterium SG8_11]
MSYAHTITIAGVLFAVLVLPLYAETETGSDSISLVTLTVTADSDDGSDYFLDANIALANQRRLILSVGQLYIKSSETNQQIEPYTVLVGLESEFDAKMPLGVELEYWDDQEHVNVKTLRGAVGYQFEKVNILIKPQIREFNFTTVRTTREYSSEGFTVNIGAEFLDNLYLYGEYGKHYYSSTLLNIAEFLLALDYVRLKLVNSVGFADDIYSLGGSLYLSWGSLSGYWLQSVSAIDQTNTYSYGGTVEVDLLQQLSLGLSLGTQSYERDDPEFVFGTLALSYYW